MQKFFCLFLLYFTLCLPTNYGLAAALPKKTNALVAKQKAPPQEKEIGPIEGTLEIRMQLTPHKSEVIQYVLAQDGKDCFLYFYDGAPIGLKTGMQLKFAHAKSVLTKKNKDQIWVSKHDYIIIKDVPPLAIPESLGPQKTIVFLINFQNKPTDRPWTVDDVKTSVFRTVNNIYNESSYGQTTVVGEVAGWYTVPMNSNINCNDMVKRLPTYAAKLAAEHGIDLSLYSHRVYLFPANRNCQWAGLGTVGGRPSHAWINGYNVPYIIGHELGHNIGLYHSHFLKCRGSSNQGNCRTIEYGDEADIMGQGETAHFNAYQKDRLGWLNYMLSPPILTVAISGTYNISAYETAMRDIKAIKILKKTLADGSHDFYYLEFRQGAGFDAPLGSCRGCDFTKGILVHQANDRDPDSSNLLDMSPQDRNTRLAALLPGNTFIDPDTDNGKLSITVNAITNTFANVAITFAGKHRHT